MTFEQWLKKQGVGKLGWTLMGAKKKAKLQAAFQADLQAGGGTGAGGVTFTDPPIVPVPAAPPAQPADPMAAFRRQQVEEMQRTGGIGRTFAEVRAGFSGANWDGKEKTLNALSDLELKAVGEGWSLEKSQLEAWKLQREAIPAIKPVGRFSLDGAVLEAACASNWGVKNIEKTYPDQVLQAAHDRFHGRYMGPQGLLLHAAYANGYQGHIGGIGSDGELLDVLHHAFAGQPGSRVLQAEASTLSLPGILSNLMNKIILEGFWAVEDAWRQICRTRTLKDFKPHTSFRFYADLTYQKVGKTGEITHGSVGEITYVTQADTYARMFTTTRQDIINDDMGALQDLPRFMGMGAAYALNQIFWTEWLRGIASGKVTPDMTKQGQGSNDAGALWQAGNANYLSGAGSALGINSLTTAKQKFLEQKKPDGKPLAIPPSRLLVPPALATTADNIRKFPEIRDTTASTKYTTGNPFVGAFTNVESAYLSTVFGLTNASDTAWWLLADPAVLAAIEIGFLNGQQTPTIQSSEADFRVLGIEHRGFFDFGVSLQESRAGVMSAGA